MTAEELEAWPDLVSRGLSQADMPELLAILVSDDDETSRTVLAAILELGVTATPLDSEPSVWDVELPNGGSFRVGPLPEPS